MSLGYVCRIDVGGANIRLDNWQRAGQADPEQVGGISRAYAGNQYSSIVAEFMVVPLVSGPISTAEYQAVDAMFAKGAQIDCDGDCFKGRPDVITCSGKVTAEMVPGGIDDAGDPLWIANLTLTEVDNADTAALTSAAVYLTNVASPDLAGANLASADAADDPFLAGLGSVRILDAATPGTCGGPAPCPATFTNPATPEKVWLTPATVRAGYISGRAVVGFLSKGASGGGAWADQAAMSKIFVVRGGVDVLEIDTDYTPNNGGFSGSFVTMTAAASVIFLSQIGDRFRVEVYGRIQLAPGAADDQPAVLARQTISFGNGGAGLHYGALSIGGISALFTP